MQTCTHAPCIMADLEWETAVSTHHTHIAGIDEAGRGALAGPVVAAAVLLPLHDARVMGMLTAVNDSKQLSPKKRDIFYDLISQYAVAIGVGVESAAVVDALGIIQATKRAMVTAVSHLDPPPDYLLIDGRIRLPSLNTPQQSIIRGDGKSLSIAAASIIAKVTRDRLMVEMDRLYTAYGFAQHKGYGTQMHRDAIAQHGACPTHRQTFAPIRQMLL